MAEEENKSEETGGSTDATTPSEDAGPAVKKAVPRKKAVRKKAVKKKAAKPASAKSEATSDPAASTAEKLATMGVSSGDSPAQSTADKPPQRIWWKALVMIAIVVVVFMYIRDLAKGPEDETAGGVDTATIPAEVLNATSATRGTPAPLPTPPQMQVPVTPPAGYAPHPWSMPPAPQQGQNAATMPAPQPYYPPVPPQGYYGYPYPPQPPYPAQPQQGEEESGTVQPYYPAPPQGYYGYPYPPQPYPAPYQQ